MPIDSSYTTRIEDAFRDAGADGLTVSEFQEAAGMSRQAAYQWRDRNAWRMTPAGKGRWGADAWHLLGITPGTVEPRQGSGAGGAGNSNGSIVGRWGSGKSAAGDVAIPELAVGDTLEVTGLRIDAGKIVVDLTVLSGAGSGRRAKGTARKLAVTLT